MPKQENNIVTRNAQGMLGGQLVFKVREGKMILAAPPTVNRNRKPTVPQAAVHMDFKRAVRYAKSAMLDPALKADYAAKVGTWQTPYNVAFRDAFRAPEVHSVISQGYHGQVGDILVISASDDFKVAAVKVSVFNADGSLIETGDAFEETKSLNWVYTVTQANATLAGSLIRVSAIDLPGNESTVEIAF